MRGIYNLLSETHHGMLQKKFKKFRKTNLLTDLHLICPDGTVSLHKIIILQKIPGLSPYLCDFCDHHSETFILLPDVDKGVLEKEVKNLYVHGTVSGLVELFGLKQKDINAPTKDEKVVKDEKIKIRDDEINNEAFDRSVAELDKEFELSNPESIQKSKFEKAEKDQDDDPLVDTEYIEYAQEETEDEKNKVIKNIKAEESEIHSFELIPCHRKNNKESRSPGILYINNRFKYFYNSEWHGKFTYQCVQRRLKNCQARALVQRDDATGEMMVARCATDDEHNHEGFDITTDGIVKKMTEEMAEMIKADTTLTTRACLTVMLNKYKEETEEKVWGNVVAHWDNEKKYKNLRRVLGRAKKHALGTTETMGSKVAEPGQELRMMVGRVEIKT